jgi:hypothetical protein
MQRRFARLFLMLALPFVPFVLVACGGGDDDDDEAPPAAEEAADEADDAEDTNEVAEATMAGEWAGSFSTGVNFTLNLTQEDDMLGGTYATDGGVNGTVAGTVTGNAVAMTITAGDTPVVSEFEGTVNDGRTSMGGDFNIVAGGGGNGTWSATK